MHFCNYSYSFTYLLVQDKAVARDAADLDVIFFAVKSLTDVFDGNDPRIGTVTHSLTYLLTLLTHLLV